MTAETTLPRNKNLADTKLAFYPRRFDGENLPKPRFPLDQLDFTNRKRLDIEIGAGQGLFAVQYCGANTDRNLVAIEHTKSRFQKMQQRASKHQLPNLLAVHANAISWIFYHVQPKSVSNIFILYPNPYPKNKHENMRWHNMPFMSHLKSCLTAGGNLHIATNVSWYAQQAELRLTNSWEFELIEIVNVDKVSNQGRLPLTHFEKKYLEAGQTCTRLTFKLP